MSDELLIPVETPDPAYRRNVGIMLLNPAGQAFVGRRLDNPGVDGQAFWQMPQGGIDPGETPEAAAMRELAEETGTGAAEILVQTPGWLVYDLPPEIVGRWGSNRYRGQAQKWFAMRFTGSDADIDITGASTPGGHPEFSDWQWVSRNRLVDLIVPFKRRVYAALLAELEPKLAKFGL